MGIGIKTLATVTNTTGAGTVLGDGEGCVEIHVTGKSGNTNPVFVGDSTVSITNGVALVANETKVFSMQGYNDFLDISKFYLAVTTSGEGVNVNVVRKN